MGDYDMDQTLAKLSNRLEELQEHQRLSRFDAVMFLGCPLIILIMTALVTIGMQTGNPVVQQIRLFGIWTPRDVFDVAYPSFVLFVVGGFLYFVRSYLKDSLVGRMWSLLFIVLGSCFIAFGLLMSPVPWPFYGIEAPEASRGLAAIVMLVRLAYGLIFFGFGSLLGAILVAFAVCDRFCMWLGRNAPKMVAAAGWLESSRFLDSGMKNFAKRAWALALLPSYSVGVILSAMTWMWSVGYVPDIIVDHCWVLAALIFFTVLNMLQSRTRKSERSESQLTRG